MKELQRIKSVYKERIQKKTSLLYTPSHPYIYMSRHEREKEVFSLLKKNINVLSQQKILEVGCGKGNKILELIQMGFLPENITGNELMTEEATTARTQLPQLITIYSGDATELPFSESSFDIVYQSMVFSSILENDFQKKLAKKMWQWVKPGGGILWYDFTLNNPKNKDVRGVPLSRIKILFPDAAIQTKRVALAPPLSRLVTKIHPSMYTLFNSLPFLRTHVLCYIQKTA